MDEKTDRNSVDIVSGANGKTDISTTNSFQGLTDSWFFGSGANGNDKLTI